MLMLICYIFYRTHVPVASVPVLNTPEDWRLRPKHVEWLCRNKTCTVLHQVGVLFDLYYDARKHKIKICMLYWSKYVCRIVVLTEIHCRFTIGRLSKSKTCAFCPCISLPLLCLTGPQCPRMSLTRWCRPLLKLPPLSPRDHLFF